MCPRMTALVADWVVMRTRVGYWRSTGPASCLLGQGRALYFGKDPL